jgi:hypothetical protein
MVFINMNNIFPSLPPLSVYVPTGGSGRVEVIDVRQENDNDTLTESDDSGGTPSVYTDQDYSLLSDDMQTMLSVRETTNEQLTKTHEVVLNEHPFY